MKLVQTTLRSIIGDMGLDDTLVCLPMFLFLAHMHAQSRTRLHRPPVKRSSSSFSSKLRKPVKIGGNSQLAIFILISVFFHAVAVHCICTCEVLDCVLNECIFRCYLILHWFPFLLPSRTCKAHDHQCGAAGSFPEWHCAAGHAQAIELWACSPCCNRHSAWFPRTSQDYWCVQLKSQTCLPRVCLLLLTRFFGCLRLASRGSSPVKNCTCNRQGRGQSTNCKGSRSALPHPSATLQFWYIFL